MLLALLAIRQGLDDNGSTVERGGDFVIKLGDFGTSFKLEEGGKSPSTQRVGTPTFWAPVRLRNRLVYNLLTTAQEIAKEANTGYRVTKWSTKSDIWGLGAVLHCILTDCVPSQDQPEKLDDRIDVLKSKIFPEVVGCSDLLLQIVCECLDPREDGRYRPSALQLLAVAVKSDTSDEGNRRSESFWQLMLTGTEAEDASAVIRYFATKHLPLLARAQTVFSPKEISIILAMVFKHCPQLIFTTHSQLCQSFSDDPLGGTAYHALAHLDLEDDRAVAVKFEQLKWPLSKEMLSMALRKNKSGILPSNLAAWGRNTPLCIRLTDIEYCKGFPRFGQGIFANFS